MLQLRSTYSKRGSDVVIYIYVSVDLIRTKRSNEINKLQHFIFQNMHSMRASVNGIRRNRFVTYRVAYQIYERVLR